jgi:hypothetical protein
MVTGDPARTPTTIMFANPDYYLYAGSANCSSPCIALDSGFAWNHGDVSPDINTTWLGMVGPGVKHLGVDGNVWSDHTDTRPTMMALLGLHDDYQHEGRALLEVIQPSALPGAVRDNLGELILLGQILKQINAPVGALGLSTLQISTTALESNSPNDSTYTQLENQLLQIAQGRNTIASQILSVLETAEFGNLHSGHNQTASQLVTPGRLVGQAQGLLNQAAKLAHTR